MTLDNSAQIFNALSDVPGDVQDVDELIEVNTITYRGTYNGFIKLVILNLSS